MHNAEDRCVDKAVNLARDSKNALKTIEDEVTLNRKTLNKLFQWSKTNCIRKQLIEDDNVFFKAVVEMAQGLVKELDKHMMTGI